MSKNDNEVIIIGGGIAGLFTASYIKDSDVIILESSRRIGWPPHCSGIVSINTYEEFRKKVHVEIESIYREAIFLDNKFSTICSVERRRPIAVKIARPRLEEELAVVAENSGHKILLGSRVEKIEMKEGQGRCIVAHNGKRFCSEHIIVAAGQNSSFAHIFARYCRKIIGIETRVELNKRLDPEKFTTIHSNRIAPEFFGWIAPIHDGRKAAIGIADKSEPVSRLAYLLKIVDKRIGVRKIISRRGGIIVRGPPSKELINKHVIGIGDILCASKPFTGGGLYAITKLAPHIANYIERERKRKRELIRIWRNLRRELLTQYYYTRFATLFRDSFLLLLSVACTGEKKGVCRIDYDRHTSLMNCLLGSVYGKKQIT